MANVRELFTMYDTANAAWEAKKLELDAAAKARSAIVEQIATAIAPRKKVERPGGQVLTIVVRGETYFFRGANASDVAKVE